MSDIYQKIRNLIFVLLGCSLFWQGCNSTNSATPVPTYIHIDSFHFAQSSLVHPYNLIASTPTLLQQYTLTTSHQTNVAWVYYNDNLIGIFDLPATFPVTTTGAGVLKVFPGIAADGENNDIINYLFNQADTFTFVPQPGKTIVHEPITTYNSGDVIGLIADFDNGKSNFGAWGGTPVSMGVISGDSVFEGLHSGIIALSTPNADSTIDSSSFSFAIPAGRAYIEFNYNSTVPFYIGLQANLSNVISSVPYYLTGVHAGTGWQKFYLEVDGFTASAQGTSYTLFIKANLLPGQTSGRLLLDNIQLVTN